MDRLNDKLLKIASELTTLYEREQFQRLYNINLIDELHAGENAHSRILRMLLQYRKKNEYPVFASFVDWVLRYTDVTDKIEIVAPRFTCEEERIDVLVEEVPHYAFIIENKIHCAIDQQQQIERYVDLVIRHGVPVEHIYVIYLTSDGNKEVSDISLTVKAKEQLGITEGTSGRFIEMNYRDDILPWLEEQVLPECTVREELLVSAVRQYIDHLKGMFGMRLEELKVMDKMVIMVKNELGLDSLEQVIETKRDLEHLNSSIELIMKKEIETIGNTYIRDVLKKFTDLNDYDLNCSFGLMNLWIRIKPKNWNKCAFSISFEDVTIYGISHFDVNNNPVDNAVRADVIARMSPLGFRTSLWWPCWKRTDKKYIMPDASFWLNVQNLYRDEVAEYVKRCFEEVYEKTKDLDL